MFRSNKCFPSQLDSVSLGPLTRSSLLSVIILAIIFSGGSSSLRLWCGTSLLISVSFFTEFVIVTVFCLIVVEIIILSLKVFEIDSLVPQLLFLLLSHVLEERGVTVLIKFFFSFFVAITIIVIFREDFFALSVLLVEYLEVWEHLEYLFPVAVNLCDCVLNQVQILERD